MGTPFMSASGFPGSLLEVILAGTITSGLTGALRDCPFSVICLSSSWFLRLLLCSIMMSRPVETDFAHAGFNNN
jgi:hypothetical protein